MVEEGFISSFTHHQKMFIAVQDKDTTPLFTSSDQTAWLTPSSSLQRVDHSMLAMKNTEVTSLKGQHRFKRVLRVCVCKTEEKKITNKKPKQQDRGQLQRALDLRSAREQRDEPRCFWYVAVEPRAIDMPTFLRLIAWCSASPLAPTRGLSTIKPCYSPFQQASLGPALCHHRPFAFH